MRHTARPVCLHYATDSPRLTRVVDPMTAIPLGGGCRSRPYFARFDVAPFPRLLECQRSCRMSLPRPLRQWELMQLEGQLEMLGKYMISLGVKNHAKQKCERLFAVGACGILDKCLILLGLFGAKRISPCRVAGNAGATACKKHTGTDIAYVG